MTKLLLTGFEPFGDVRINASQKLVERAGEQIAIPGVDLVCEILPVRFESGPERIAALLRQHRPALALSFGVAPRPCVCLEQLALNYAFARIPDNEGKTPEHRDLVEPAPPGYWSVFRHRRDLIDALAQRNVPAVLSTSAGAYVCNAVMFSALHTIAAENLPTRYGFVHIPQLPQEMAGATDERKLAVGSMSLDLTFAALETLVTRLIEAPANDIG